LPVNLKQRRSFGAGMDGMDLQEKAQLLPGDVGPVPAGDHPER
jgi:hypothetical protein